MRLCIKQCVDSSYSTTRGPIHGIHCTRRKIKVFVGICTRFGRFIIVASVKRKKCSIHVLCFLTKPIDFFDVVDGVNP